MLSESFPSLGVTIHLTSLGCPPILCWSLALLWRQLRFQSGPAPVCSCLQCPQLSELVRFLLWALSGPFVDPTDTQAALLIVWFNLRLVQLVGRFGSSSLATLPLRFSCGFIPTSTCGLATGVCS